MLFRSHGLLLPKISRGGSLSDQPQQIWIRPFRRRAWVSNGCEWPRPPIHNIFSARNWAWIQKFEQGERLHVDSLHSGALVRADGKGVFMVIWKRTLRISSSERFLGINDGKDAVAVDLHFLSDGTVAGTVILLEASGLAEAQIPKLLASLDEDFLPGVDLNSGNLTFTVVTGRVLGNYEACNTEPQS